MSDNARRIEARPLNWESLSDAQQEAARAASSWLVDAIGSISQDKSRKESGGLPDRDRHSQVGFIDGDRGTGKTSVFLTLQAITLEKNYVFPEKEALDSPARKLRDNKRHVVWLDTLDMEPLSKGTNLFAAILARIAHVLDKHDAGVSPMASALAEADSKMDAYGELQRLQNDAAIVWERLDGGKHTGDPQTRAVWVNQAEKAGLELNPRMGKVLDGIARVISKSSKFEDPLFVLPVDDFDLAPSHCLELLRLIRMLSTPRLFFLVIGNIRIAEAVLKLRTEGDLALLASSKPSDPQDVQNHAAEIAANNMRKLLPPAQRSRLAELRWQRALALPWGESNLKEILTRIKFEANQEPVTDATTTTLITLSKFLLLEELDLGNLTTAEWLGGTPRQILDWCMMFEQIAQIRLNGRVEKDEADDLSLIILLEDFHRQVLEEWRLPYALRERIAEMLDISINISLNFDPYIHIEQKYPYLPQQLNETTQGGLVSFSPVSTHVSVISRNETKVEIPRRLGRGLIFIHDFAFSLWGGYVQSNPLTFTSEAGPRVGFRWKIAKTKMLTIEWHRPEWWTFRDFERFTRHWDLHKNRCAGRFGAAWLAAMLEVVMNEECKPGHEGLEQTRLTDLLMRLVTEKPTELTPIRTARRLLRLSVLEAVALLLAPESQSGLNVFDFETSEIGFTTSIVIPDKDHDLRKIQQNHTVNFSSTILNPDIRNRIREARTRRWREVWKYDRLDTLEGITLCATIAPKLTWKLTMQELSKILEKLREAMPESVRDNLFQTISDCPKQPKKADDVSSALKTLENIQSEPFLKTQDENIVQRLLALLQGLNIVYEVMRQQRFNMIVDGVFEPTEEDIERIQ